jgi:hypothetical protein
MPISNDDAHLELSMGAAARVAHKTHDEVHRAMVSGALPHHRDRDGRRVVKLGDLLAYMRAQPPAIAAE